MFIMLNGLVSLLNPLKLYRTIYHSLGLVFKNMCENNKCHWEILMFVNFIPAPEGSRKSQDFDLRTIFGRDLVGRCGAAKSSQIVIANEGQRFEPQPSASGPFAVFNLPSIPNLANLAVFSDAKGNARSFRPSVDLTSLQAGFDQYSGKLFTTVYNRGQSNRVVYSHALDWFINIQYHTLKLACVDINDHSSKDTKILRRSFVPALSRIRPALMEFDFILPEKSECTVSFDFKKSFMKLREYPADANYGMLLPPAMLTFVNSKGLEDEIDNFSPSKSKTRTSQPLVVYGNPILLAMPVPDFSMPFNVVCLVMLTFSLLFGQMYTKSVKVLTPVVDSKEIGESAGVLTKLKKHWKKILKIPIILLIILCGYLEYYEISLNEVRRTVVRFTDSVKDKLQDLNDDRVFS